MKPTNPIFFFAFALCFLLSACVPPDLLWHADNDGDGYGDPLVEVRSTLQPEGFVLNALDCDDNDANNFPRNIEVFDGADNDCDGLVDERRFYADKDADQYGDAADYLDSTSWPEDGSYLYNYVLNSEDCDDSNSMINPGLLDGPDGLDNDCDTDIDEDQVKVVFVSSSWHPSNLGGLEGADAICQSLADQSDIPAGEYKAWLSSSTESVADRLAHSDVPYVRPDFKLLANNWLDLVTNGVVAPIRIDEQRNEAGSSVWTNTRANGESYYTDYEGACGDWYGLPALSMTRMGNSSRTAGEFTEASFLNCTGGNNYRIYCFQQ